MKLFKHEYAQPYYLQIISQCDHAIEAMQELHIIFLPNESGRESATYSEVFMLVSSFLNSVNNIHKTFYNNKTPFSKERSKFLRSAFGDIHKELPSRNIRNSIEHFDEKLDEHVVKYSNFIDQNVSITNEKMKDNTGIVTYPPTPYFRHLNYVKSSQEFYIQLLGKEMNMSKVELIIREIKVKSEELAFGHLRPS